MADKKRICKSCLLEQPIANFTVIDRKGHRRGICRSCDAARVRAYYAANPQYRSKAAANSVKWQRANPEKAAVFRRASQIKKKYGLTPEQYESLLVDQGNACALCGAKQHGHRHSNGKQGRLPGGHSTNWPIDHCHETGRVRGLLCHACNVRLGGYEVLLRSVGEAKLNDYLKGTR